MQHCLDSNRQWQISQSDCEITSNCGKNGFTSRAELVKVVVS